MTTDVAGQVDIRERVLRVLVAQVFLIFFQGFMVAPLVPRLAETFHASTGRVGALVPAYMIPYGCVCLVVGPLADRFGRARVLRTLLFASILLPALTATASSLPVLLGWRVVTGLALGGVTPVGLALIATMFPYEERGRPVGWIFGAIAGGMAVGATFGPWLETIAGWRGIFIVVAGLAALVAVVGFTPLGRIASAPPASALGARALAAGFLALLGSRRGAVLYGLVLANGIFHGGVFAWLGVYFVERHGLAPRELGFAMLGYGIPGFFGGPIIGRLADRHGRRGMIRAGLFLASLCAAALWLPLPTLGATLFVTLLSVGFDLTHPLFSGMITTLDPKRGAQAMALNTFAVFIGMGVGSLVFGALHASIGFTTLIVFASAQAGVGALTLLFGGETWR